MAKQDYGDRIPAAPGFRNIGSDTMQYIPLLFSGKMLAKFYANSVLPGISNTDYQGDIKSYGDTIKIRKTPDIDIHEYQKGQTLRNDMPESDTVELTIDKAKYWSLITDDVDDAQTDLKGYIGKWAADAAEQMRIKVEREAFADFPSDADGDNQGNGAGAISHGYDLGELDGATGANLCELTRDNIVERIVDWGAVLDEQNIPDAGRFVILPVRAMALLKTSDLKNAFMTGDSQSAFRNGLVGSIDRFNIYSSNLLNWYDRTEGATTKSVVDVVFGSDLALTFATQIVKTKVQDNPDGFGMLHRGLQVYGYSVVQPTALGLVRAKLSDASYGA
jgi:hypothetical protein